MQLYGDIFVRAIDQFRDMTALGLLKGHAPATACRAVNSDPHLSWSYELAKMRKVIVEASIGHLMSRSIDDDDGMLDVGFGVLVDHRDHPWAALLVKDHVPICPTRRAGFEVRHDHVPPKVAIFEIIARDRHGLGISDPVGVADFRHPQG